METARHRPAVCFHSFLCLMQRQCVPFYKYLFMCQFLFMESVTIFPEAFVALPWGNLYEEYKIGGQPAFIWQQAKLFETSYNTVYKVYKYKLQTGCDRKVGCRTVERNSLCYVSQFHFQKSFSVFAQLCDALLASSCVNSATDGATDELHCITITDIFDTNIDSGANTDCKLTVRRRQFLENLVLRSEALECIV